MYIWRLGATWVEKKKKKFRSLLTPSGLKIESLMDRVGRASRSQRQKDLSFLYLPRRDVMKTIFLFWLVSRDLLLDFSQPAQIESEILLQYDASFTTAAGLNNANTIE
jgi:hypothetical protein